MFSTIYPSLSGQVVCNNETKKPLIQAENTDEPAVVIHSIINLLRMK